MHNMFADGCWLLHMKYEQLQKRNWLWCYTNAKSQDESNNGENWFATLTECASSSYADGNES